MAEFAIGFGGMGKDAHKSLLLNRVFVALQYMVPMELFKAVISGLRVLRSDEFLATS